MHQLRGLRRSHNSNLGFFSAVQAAFAAAHNLHLCKSGVSREADAVETLIINAI
ncbi:MAG: hypothetical protein RR326_11010 [Stenotrophomonas sp.]